MSSSDKKKLKIALVNVLNKNKKYAMNKDLNGGFGTADDLGDSLFLRLLKIIRKRSTKLPIMSFAFLQAIFKNQGHMVQYFEGTLPEQDFDMILIYGSIVDYKNENDVSGLIKKIFLNQK